MLKKSVLIGIINMIEKLCQKTNYKGEKYEISNKF